MPDKSRADKARDAGYLVRPAQLEDAAPMATLHVQVWRDTYTGLMRQETLDSLDPVQSAQRWEDLLSADDYDGTVFVGLEPGGDLVALGSAGPARDDDAPTPHELRSINLSRQAQGTGLADLMLAQLIGDGAAYLWVAEHNPRAIAFYKRHGFTFADSRWAKVHGINELRMVRGNSRGSGEAAATTGGI